MVIVDWGSGPPIVVIPGIQGRWEWMKPGIEALARRCRVITYSLCDEPSSHSPAGRTGGFDAYVNQVGEALDQAGLQRAAICGISYGGLIASAFAARYPDRTASLVLVSALPPSWSPDRRVRFYLKAPRALAPVFWLGALFRVHRELKAAMPRVGTRVRTGLTFAWQVIRNPPSPARMSRRARLVETMNSEPIADLGMPTLVVTGDAGLDRVVPVHATRLYATLIPHAQVTTLERTGHFGVVTRPDAFADLIAPFIATHAEDEIRRHA